MLPAFLSPDDLFNRDINEDDEGAKALQNLIGHFIDDVDAQNSLRDAILEDSLDNGPLGALTKRAGRCRIGRCIMRGPNPNAGSRVLPFGKRGDDLPGQVARRGRGSARNARPRGDRPLLPFGKRR